jgi:hypothetical protein
MQIKRILILLSLLVSFSSFSNPLGKHCPDLTTLNLIIGSSLEEGSVIVSPILGILEVRLAGEIFGGVKSFTAWDKTEIYMSKLFCFYRANYTNHSNVGVKLISENFYKPPQGSPWLQTSRGAHCTPQTGGTLATCLFN